MDHGSASISLVNLNDVLLFDSDAAALVNNINDVLQLLISVALMFKPFKCELFT